MTTKTKKKTELDYLPFKKALARGMKLFPAQKFGAWFFANGADKACVLGTACVGALGCGPIPNIDNCSGEPVFDKHEGGSLAVDDDLTNDLLRAAYPWLNKSEPCPVKRCQMYYHIDLYDTAIHLNDEHKWSRERIGDFLEPFEKEWLAKHGD